jgi:hypothetical protein
MSDILVTTPGDVTIDVTPGGDVTVEVTYNPVAGSGGDTNIGITPTASTVVVTSSSGTDGTILAASGTDAGVFTAANYTKLAAISGTNTGDQFIFKNVAVSGQSTVIAETTNDTLTLVAGTNVTITTDAGTDSVTINASGGWSCQCHRRSSSSLRRHYGQTFEERRGSRNSSYNSVHGLHIFLRRPKHSTSGRASARRQRRRHGVRSRVRFR